MTERRPHTLASTRRPLHDEHDAILLDLDGVVYVGADAVPGASAALTSAVDAGAQLAYLTNNAARPAGVVADHLRELGMPVQADGDVVTSAQAVSELVAAAVPAGSRVLLVGGPGLREPLEAAGLVCVSELADQPVAVVQGYHADVGWTQLAEASYAVESGLPWFASNTDLTIPTARGVAPGNGALVHAVRLATGAEPRVAGKPERPLFDETLRRIPAERPLMVGDRLDTDIDGAIGAGIASLAVLTGVSSLADLFAAGPGHRPDHVGADLGALGVDHPPVELAGETARCGGAEATLVGDRVEIRGADARDVTALRAAVQLAWSIRDTSGRDVLPGGTLEP